MKLNTVNVIEYIGGTIACVSAYSDDEEGNETAERVFTKIAEENEFSEEEIEFGLEEGRLEHSNRDYQLYLTHSV